MNTTDKDIRALEEMRKTCERCIEIGCSICPAQRTALSNILSDFRDMREMLEAARNVNGADWGVRRELPYPDKWYAWHSNWEGGTTGGFNSALDAWRDGVKGEK